RWRTIKRLYNRWPAVLRPLLLVAVGVYFLGRSVLTARGRRRGTLPIAATGNQRSKERGMSRWHDLVDWVGGYPFEVAKPEDVFDALKTEGFELRYMKKCAGHLGCKEFVLAKNAGPRKAPRKIAKQPAKQ